MPTTSMLYTKVPYATTCTITQSAHINTLSRQTGTDFIIITFYMLTIDHIIPELIDFINITFYMLTIDHIIPELITVRTSLLLHFICLQ